MQYSDVELASAFCKFVFLGSELVSDLPLQMCLYFNTHFSIFWFVSIIAMFIAKVNIEKIMQNLYKYALIFITSLTVYLFSTCHQTFEFFLFYVPV